MSHVHTTVVAESTPSGRLLELRERAARSIQQREQSLAALEACQRKLSAAERENSQLAEVVHQLQAQVARSTRDERPSAAAQRQLQALRTERDESRALAAAKHKEVEELTAKVRQAGSWRAQAQRRVATLEAENQGLLAQVKELGEQLERSRARNGELLRDEKRARRELDASQQSVERLRRESKALQSSRDRELENLRQALACAESEAQAARKVTQTLEASLDELCGQSSVLEASLADRQTTVHKLQVSIAQQSDAMEELQSSLAARSERINQLEQVVVERSARLDELEQRCAEQTAELEAKIASDERQDTEELACRGVDPVVHLRASRVFHQVGEVFGAALKRAVGGLAWISLTDAWEQRIDCMPEPDGLPDGDVEALERRLQHWFVETGFSREILVRSEGDAIKIQVANSEAGDDSATIVAQAAVLVPLLLRSRFLALRDIGDGDIGRQLVFLPDRRKQERGVE